jgi:hypothetical protein
VITSIRKRKVCGVGNARSERAVPFQDRPINIRVPPPFINSEVQTPNFSTSPARQRAESPVDAPRIYSSRTAQTEHRATENRHRSELSHATAPRRLVSDGFTLRGDCVLGLQSGTVSSVSLPSARSPSRFSVLSDPIFTEVFVPFFVQSFIHSIEQLHSAGAGLHFHNFVPLSLSISTPYLPIESPCLLYGHSLPWHYAPNKAWQDQCDDTGILPLHQSHQHMMHRHR